MFFSIRIKILGHNNPKALSILIKVLTEGSVFPYSIRDYRAIPMPLEEMTSLTAITQISDSVRIINRMMHKAINLKSILTIINQWVLSHLKFRAGMLA